MIGCNCIYEINGIDTDDMATSHPEIYHNGPTEQMEEVFDKAVSEKGGYLPWKGEVDGAAECRERGWYIREITDNDGNFVRWERCSKDDPGAMEDLNRWESVRRMSERLQQISKS